MGKLILGKQGIAYVRPWFHSNISATDNIKPINGNITIKLP